MGFSERSSLFKHFNSLCEVNGVWLHLVNAVVSEKITFFWKCINFIPAYIRNSHAFLWKKSSQFKHFNSLSKESGDFIYLVNAVVSENITVFWKCLKRLTRIHVKLTCVSWKKLSLFKHFNSWCEVNGVCLYLVNAVVSEKITFFWQCIKLLTSIHEKLTCVSQ